MRLSIQSGDILATPADTLALPVDGSAPGLEGRIARQLMARVGVEDMHELCVPPPSYPFNGQAYWSSALPHDRTHFRHICCLGVLSHAPGANHKGYARSALLRMLRMAGAEPGKGENIACPVLTGGHRIKYVDAVFLMLQVIESVQGSATIHITEFDPERLEILRDIVG